MQPTPSKHHASVSPGDMPHGHVSPGETALLQAVVRTVETERALSIAIIAGDGTVAAHRIASPIVVGRDPSCELVLVDRAASRHHARLVPRGGTLEVVDLGSRNGTFVNGQRVTRAVVEPGTAVRVGDVVLLVVQLDEVWRPSDATGPLVGGAAIAPVRRTIGLVGPTELPVLITGETGTGKEVVARLVHAASGRRGSFVAVNCAALPEHLVESELFGHVRGAFTGADRTRQGLLALADGGTLFLDELGELPLPAQAKLLRVLEDRMVRAVGAERASPVDVRFVSATNVDLPIAVADGRFRTDLHARLAAVELRLPALRSRREDLPSLIAFLLARAGRPSLRLSGDALEALLLHDWPQNIRELDNLVRVLALRGEAIELADLPHHFQVRLQEARHAHSARGPASRDDARRTQIITALQAHHGNVRRAASAAGMARGHFYRLLKKFALDPASFRTRGANAADRGDAP